MATKEECIEQLKEGVIEFLDEQVLKASKEGIDAGYPALELIMDDLAVGMDIVG